MRTRWMVVVGAVLPLLLGAALFSSTTSEGAGTWAYPMTATAFVVLSVGLAVAHLLVLPVYLAGARTLTGAARTAAVVGGAGTAAVAVCELWSGALATTALDAPVVGALEAAFGVTSLAIIGGTLVMAAALRRSRSPLAWPVGVNGATLLAAMPLLLVSDGLGTAALTVWQLTYAWWGLRLGRTAPGDAGRGVGGPPVAGRGGAGAPVS